MINTGDILETIKMIREEHLDIRTITMGISLRDCAAEDMNRLCTRIYDKITKTAEHLVRTGEDIERDFGIPIINKRISVTPIAIVADACGARDYTPIAQTLDRAAAETGVNFIGGFSALVHKGFTPGDRALIDSIPEALAMLNDAVKKGGVMASSQVGGLSGAFIPVSEDAGMIDAVRAGVLHLDKLEAMTAVCSVGLDMIAIPGDTSEETICAIIADEISIGVANNKTTACRLIPAYGCKVGDEVEFGGLLGSAPVMEVGRTSPARFIARGGRIPAPIHSLRN